MNAAVGDSAGDLTFYEMVPSVLSTCKQDEVQAMLANGSASLLGEYTVPVVTIDDLYRKHLAPRPVLLLPSTQRGTTSPYCAVSIGKRCVPSLSSLRLMIPLRELQLRSSSKHRTMNVSRYLGATNFTHLAELQVP